jgi:hypothetical protein
MVRRRVDAPIRAAAWAASQPACPAPITKTSNSFGYFHIVIQGTKNPIKEYLIGIIQ